MKILCIDTSSKLCGVAILDDTTLIKKIELDNGLTHSESLMPLIDQVLKECNLSLKDINLLVSDIGPGSFTGIRIGIATVKAFADSLNIPCIGISSLEVLAYNVSTDGLICSTIDCKNDNCYFALYELKNGNYKVLEPPTSESISNVLDLLNFKYENTNITFVGDGIKENSISNYLDSFNLGIAGFNKFISNNKNGEEILPMYLKIRRKTQEIRRIIMDFKIDKMSLEDLISIKDILTTEFDDFWNYEILKSELESTNSYFFVAKNISGEIVGFAGIKIILDEADIMNIVVKKDFRNIGIGALLLDYMIYYSKNIDLKTITLEVNEINIPAIKLYEKFDFEKLGIRKKYYNGENDAIIMSKKIKLI